MSAAPIYVDMDDVLCEMGRCLISLLEREFGRRVPFDQIHDYDLGISFGLTPGELERFFEVAHRPEILASLDPLPGAIETVKAWAASGAEIAVVTGRPSETAAACRKWLERHQVPHHELTFVDKYGRDDAASDDRVVPLEALGSASYRLAVEDSLPTARFLARRGIPVLLVDRPWNQGAADGVRRCGNWAEVALAAREILAAAPAPSARSAAAIPS